MSSAQAERQKSNQQAQSLSALAALWDYSDRSRKESSVTLRRPNEVDGAYTWTVDGCEYQVSNSRIRSFEMWEWVTREQWIEGTSVLARLTLTPEGAIALWGDA